MIVVSNTSPLCYLVLLGSADALPELYGGVIATQTVLAELRHPDAPESVRDWAGNPPAWLRVYPDPLDPEASLSSLHAGERTTILLAERLRADLVLLDDSAARGFATQRQLGVSGLLGVLRDAAQADLIDLATAVDRLRQTNFRASPELLKSLLLRQKK